MNIGLIVAELLHENNTVTIPKFGGISTCYKPSEHQNNVGKYAPPASTISFNPSLIIDDGLLIDQVAKTYRLTFSQATNAVHDFVKSIQILLDKGETVKMEQIGQFYKQNDTIKFLPSENNYNKESFGLPTISVQPILELDSKEKTSFVKPPIQAIAPDNKNNINIPKQALQWMLLLLGAIGLGIAIYFLVQNINFGNSAIITEEINTAAQDQKGSTTVEEAPIFQEEVTEVDTIRRSETPIISQPTRSAPIAPTTKPKEVPVNQKTAKSNNSTGKQIKIIVVGAFDSSENAEKRVTEIQSAGYVPYRFTRNGRRCIGIEYQYQQEEDFIKTLQDVRNKFGKDAWVLTE